MGECAPWSKVWRKEIFQITGKIVKVKEVAGWDGGRGGRGQPADRGELEGRVRGEEEQAWSPGPRCLLVWVTAVTLQGGKPCPKAADVFQALFQVW